MKAILITFSVYIYIYIYILFAISYHELNKVSLQQLHDHHRRQRRADGFVFHVDIAPVSQSPKVSVSKSAKRDLIFRPNIEI